MAELVGLVVGIAAFALQIGGTIESIRALREFTPADIGEQLDCLSGRLELFRRDLLTLQPLESHPHVQPAVQHASKRFQVVENVLQNVQHQFHPEASARRPGYGTALKLVFSRRRVEAQIKKVEDNINGMSLDVSRACVVFLSLQHPQASGSTVLVHHVESSLDESGDAAVIQESATTTEQVVAETTSARREQNHMIARGTKRPHCGQRHCDCSCHLTGKKSGRFWFLEYTPLSILLKEHNGRCGSNRFCLNFRLALSNYGFPYAIVAGLNITADAIGFNLQPALRTERIVKYTSPGFETLRRLLYGFISLEGARTLFFELYRSDPSFRDHRNPSGHTYLQELLRYPWSYHCVEQLELLRMFVDEFEMTLEDQDSSFLTMCARWIGEGPHLKLLDAILECGFDPTAVHSPLWEHWPVSFSPNWCLALHTPDPFFIEYLATLVRYDSDFSGSTPQCNTVLVGSDREIEDCILRTHRLEESRTFLGQSPLHLAITRPNICQLLLDAGHDLNATDKWGATPLMYAAGMGQGETVTLLLSRGADPTILSHPNTRGEDRRTFIQYAIARGHTDLILDALQTIQQVHGIQEMQAFSQLATLEVISNGHHLNLGPRTPFLLELIKNLANVNVRISDETTGVDGNNLMHYVRSVEEASALVQRGFNQFNSPNSDGKLAIDSLARYPDPALIKFCIEHGSNVGNKDKDGRTLLFNLVSASLSPADRQTHQTLTAIRLCLVAGVDIFEADDCKCPCSPGGCTISSVFSLEFSKMRMASSLQYRPELLCSLEWVMLVKEHCGVEAARQVLLLLLRRAKCKESEIDITHTCCHRGRGIPSGPIYGDRPPRLTDEDIAEIQEEESEFIDILEAEMETLVSESLHDLWSKWILVIKAEYDAHVVDIKKKDEQKEKHKPPLVPRPPDNFQVDYKNDTYHFTLYCSIPETAYPIARMLGSYAFWLHYEQANPSLDISLREVRPAGWYEKRVSWLREFIKVMGVSAEAICAEMRRIHKDELKYGSLRAGCKMNLDFLM